MMRPTSRCLVFFGLAGVSAILPAVVDGSLWTLWLAMVAAILALIAGDAVAATSPSRISLKIEAPAEIPVGGVGRLSIELEFPQPLLRPVRVLIDVDPTLEPPPLLEVALESDAVSRSEFVLRARRRGLARVHAIWLSWTGPLQFVEIRHRRELAIEIPLVPDIGGGSASALRFLWKREARAGPDTEPQLGEGSEFDRIREYVPGLDYRSIDWKASARHQKLLCREYRVERDRPVWLAFDTGHLMSEPLEGIPRLDHAVNAGLLLSYACLETGDRVGLFAFDEKPRLFQREQAGIRALKQLQRRCAELEYGVGETNFGLGLTELSSRIRRRALVIVFTELVDTTSAEIMVRRLGRLARRHLVLFVTLSDADLGRFVAAEPDTVEGLNRAVVAREMLRERREVARRLERAGVLCLDSEPKALSADLVGRYLDIKRRELIG